MATNRIRVLDGWRCFSILLVIYGHLTTNAPFAPLLPLHGYADLGVSFFFVISGFVICSGLQRETETAGRIAVASFYIRRCFRILPPLAIYLIIMLAFRLAPPQSIIRSALFLCNLTTCELNVTHTWSLAYEEQFYIAFPLALILSMGRRWLFLAAALAWPFLVTLFHALKLGSFPQPFELLLFGVALALYRDEVAVIVQRIGPIGLYIAVPLIFALHGWDSRLAALTMVFVCYPLIAYAVFASTCVRTAIHPILESKPAQYIGLISYGVYLFQQPFTCAQGQSPMFYAMGIVAIFGSAALSYTFIETPLIRLGAKLSAIARSMSAIAVPVDQRF
jgi:peptidoglycan/LPS O-acetylase OafA/YrhL